MMDPQARAQKKYRDKLRDAGAIRIEAFLSGEDAALWRTVVSGYSNNKAVVVAALKALAEKETHL